MRIIQNVDKNIWQAILPLLINEKDGSIMVWIPPGEFEMGDGKDSDCPMHRVFLDGYYLGVHCITNRQYGCFVEATGHRPPYNILWQDRTKADHSVVNISWKDAIAYCAWAGLALPTEAQWERGARGPGNLCYPWGNCWDAVKCRHGNNRGSETTCPVSAYPQGVSGFGTLNQSGNVWEWCRDWYDNEYYSKSPARNPEGPSTGSSCVIRGGSWRFDFTENLRAACRYYGIPADRFDDRGFRPCLPPGQ